MEGKMKLITNNLNVQYKEHKVLIDCSFEMDQGEVVGLIAPNGSGKTTLLKTLMGLQKAKSGNISIINNKKNIICREEYLKNLFFIESNESLYDNLTVEEHLKIVKRAWKSPITINAAVNFFDIQRFLKKKVKQLSLGMKQQLILTMYLISDAPIWIIDEPLNGLDPTNAYLFNQLIERAKRENRLVLMSSHNLINISEICNRVLFLYEGSVVEKVYKDNESESSALEEMYQKLFFKGRNYV